MPPTIQSLIAAAGLAARMASVPAARTTATLSISSATTRRHRLAVAALFPAASLRFATTKATPPPPPKPTAAPATSGASSLFQAALAESSSSSSSLPPPPTQGALPATTSSAGATLRTLTFKSGNSRTSPWKSNLVARVVRGLPLESAIAQAAFSAKRAGGRLRSLLHRARAVIAQQHGSTADRWVVRQCFVGKGKYLRRIKIHARGKLGVMHHPASHFKVVLEEVPRERVDETEAAAKKRVEREKLVKIFKRHRLYVPLSTHQPVRFLHPVWSKKPYRYITSPKWMADTKVLAKRR
ncbi:ribosomal protein L22/L17 [Zopfochytrium polystomum]|nr:ribosomal protein L22/L17 [Zopfochytrium polystomum]